MESRKVLVLFMVLLIALGTTLYADQLTNKAGVPGKENIQAPVQRLERHYNPQLRDDIDVYPQNADYWTGSTDGASMTQTSMINAIGDVEAGWIKFDVSSIPDACEINSVTLHVYVNDTNWPYWSVTPLFMDPVTSAPADLFTAMAGATGQDVCYSYNNEGSDYAPGWYEYPLTGTVNEDLAASLQNDWFAVGMADRDGGTSYYAIFDGWAEDNTPYLSVNYTAYSDEDDAGVLSIDMPQVMMPGDVAPMATVKNFCTSALTFDVTMTIDDGYTSTLTVTDLPAGAQQQVTFDTWAAGLGTWEVTVETDLASDVNPNNDMMSMNVAVQDLQIAYVYNAYDPSGTYPEGPGYIFLQEPTDFYLLAETTSADFLAGGTFVNGSWYGCEYGSGAIYEIDMADGSMTMLGTTGVGFNGLAFDPTSQNLYGVTSTDLYIIDMNSWTATMLGAMGNAGGVMIGFAINTAGQAYGADLGDDNLYSIDLATGAATVVGPLGVDISYAQTLEFDNNVNVLYLAGYTAVGQLFTVDTATGSATLIGDFPGGMELTGMAIPYTMGDTGMLSGVVTDGVTGDPIEGAVVEIGPMTGTTGADGSYYIDYIATGTYDVTCMAPPYYSPETVTGVEIMDATETEQDFSLMPIDLGILEGNVISAYDDSPIENAMVAIGEWVTYTDAMGDYEITGIVPGVYDVTCSAGGFQAQTVADVEIVGGETDVVDFALPLYFAPPQNLTAEVQNFDVYLDWDPPAGGGAEWLHWDSGENNDGIGLTSGGTFHYAAKWDADMMAPYAGLPITAINFFPRSTAGITYTFKVWTGTNPPVEQYSQDVTDYTTEAWNEFTLDTPYSITGEELWVGFTVTHGAGDYVAGCDAGPAVAGYGDMIMMDGDPEFAPLSGFGLDYNWNIQALVDPGRGEAIALGNFNPEINHYPKAANTDAVSRGYLRVPENNEITYELPRDLIGYKLYRNGGEIVEITDPETTDYLDVAPGMGIFEYYVTGVFPEGESAPSNIAEVSIMNEFFVDDFENGAGNWEITTNGQEGTWMLYSEPYPNSYNMPPTSFGNVMAADADELYPVDSELIIANPIDCSNYGSVLLSFDSDFNAINDSDAGYVYVSNDGTNWNLVLEYIGVDVTAVTEEINISEYAAGQATVWVKFHSVQPGWDWWWAIDNFKLMNDQPPLFGDLEGTVTDAETGNPISGAMINAGTYSATTEADGTYEITSMLVGNYEVSCAATGYEMAMGNAAITDGGTEVVDFELEPLPDNYPVENLMAEVVDYNDVTLTWDPPAGQGGELSWCDVYDNNSIGTGGAFDFDVAARFTPTELNGFGGLYLTSINFAPSEAACEYYLRVWEGGSGNPYDAGTLLVDQMVDAPEIGVEQIVELDTPVMIDASQELWIGYRANATAGYPAGVDAGPAIEGFGDLIYDAESGWVSMNAAYALNYNWVITGYASTSREGDIAVPITKSVQRNTNENHARLQVAHTGVQQAERLDRELTGYDVYRDGTLLASLDPTVTTYDDMALDAGTYEYSVVATYSEDDAEAVSVEVSIYLNAPDDVTGTVNGNIAVLQWADPPEGNQGGGGDTEELIYDSGMATDGYTYVGYTMSSQMSPAEACQVLTLRYYISTGAGGTFNAEVYDWDGSQPGTTLLHSVENVSPAADEAWCDVDVSGDNLMIDGDFMVGFGSIDGATYMGFDGNDNNGRSWDFDGESWASWSETYLLRAIVQYSDGRIAEIAPTVVPAQRRNTSIQTGRKVLDPNFDGAIASRELTGFKIYRDGGEIAEVGSGTHFYSDQEFPGEATYNITALYSGGFESDFSDDIYLVDADDTPSYSTELQGAYPNPFNPVTSINFSLAEETEVTIDVYNILGQKVKTLVNDVLPQGQHNIIWKGKDDNNKDVTSGIYFYKMKGGRYTSTKKMILLK